VKDSRLLGSITAALLILAAAAAAALAPGPATAAHRDVRVTVRPELDGAVLAAINRVRASHALRPLRPAKSLAAAAALHSREMAEDGFFAHESPGGEAFWIRVKNFYPAIGFRRWLVGETILWASPDTDGSGAVRDWLDSPEHRRILLGSTWREAGVAAIHVPTAPGTYHGLEVTIITADFGSRTR
jgi:uncharacterized protein YkwD